MRTPRKPSRSSGTIRPIHKPENRHGSAERNHLPTDWIDDEGPEKLQKIAGLQAVSALFRRHPDRVVRLYYGKEMKHAAGPFCSELAKLHRPYRLLEDEELVKVAGTPLHGGIVAAATQREIPPISFDELASWAKSRNPLIILDGIGNPNNLGAIARTMAFFGLEHLLLSDHPEQGGLSDSAYRVAEGGLEYLKIARLPNLPVALRSIRQYYRVVGTSLARHAAKLEALPPDQLRANALVLGNEQSGLSRATLAACEAVITIPAKGQIQSLNVAATAAILIHQMSMMADKETADIKKARSHRAKLPTVPGNTDVTSRRRKK